MYIYITTYIYHKLIDYVTTILEAKTFFTCLRNLKIINYYRRLFVTLLLYSYILYYHCYIMYNWGYFASNFGLQYYFEIKSLNATSNIRI